MGFLFILVVLSMLGFFLPPWVTWGGGYLIVRSLVSVLVPGSVVAYRYIDLLPSDLFLLGAIARASIDAFIGRLKVKTNLLGTFPGLFVYLFAMFLATFISYIRYGQDFFEQEIVSLLRLLVVPLGPLFVLSLYNLEGARFRTATRVLRWSAYLAATTIYFGPFLRVGEINPVEGNMAAARYQGILGDSVKLFLLPFIFWEFIRGNLVGGLYLVIALLMTGGRFGIVGFVLGVLVIMWLRPGRVARSPLWAFGGLVLVLGFVANLGGASTRFFSKDILLYGLGRRAETWLLGLQMARDHWITGAGYNAFRLLFPEYSSTLLPGRFVPFETETFSQVIKSFLDGGLLGLIGFVWMMFDFIRVSRFRYDTVQGKEARAFCESVLVSLVVFSLLSPFVVWLNPGSKIGWGLMALLGVMAGQASPRQLQQVRRVELSGAWRLPSPQS